MKYCDEKDLKREDISREINTDPDSTIEMEELIESDCKCVAITGAAKAGKTMLVLKTIQKYLNSDKFEYIFYCDFNHDSLIEPFQKLNLFDFLTSKIRCHNWMNDGPTCNEVLEEIIDSKSILLIMDHFEILNLHKSECKRVSYFNESTRENIIMNILRSFILRDAKKIIISRPFNLEWMRMWPDIKSPRHLSFFGFNRKTQSEIFKQNYSHLIPNLFENSSIFPDVWSFCFSPYLCCLIEKCFYEKELFQLTTTFTFTLTFLTFVDRLKKDHQNNFDLEILAKFAFSQFSQNKLCFDKDDFSKEKLSNDCIRSFFTTLPCSSDDELLDDDEYKSHFSHILIQEFLVALHLISLPEEEFLQEFDDMMSDNSYLLVRTFLFGLSDKRLEPKLKRKLSLSRFKNLNKNIKHLKTNIKDNFHDQQDLELISRYCQYIHEMHNDEFTRFVMKPTVPLPAYSLATCYIRIRCSETRKSLFIVEQDKNMW